MSMNNGSTELGPEIKMENPRFKMKSRQSASDGSSSLTRTHPSVGVQAEVEFEETEPSIKADVQIDTCETGNSLNAILLNQVKTFTQSHLRYFWDSLVKTYAPGGATCHGLGCSLKIIFMKNGRPPDMSSLTDFNYCTQNYHEDGSGCDAWLSVTILLKVTKQSLPVKGVFKIINASPPPSDHAENCKASPTGEQLAWTDEGDRIVEADDDWMKLEGELLPPHVVERMTDIPQRTIDEQMKFINLSQEVGEEQIQDDVYDVQLNGPFEDTMGSMFAPANAEQDSCVIKHYDVSDIETHSEPGTVELFKLPDSPRHTGNSAEATCEIKTMQCSENATVSADVEMHKENPLRQMSVRVPKLNVTQNMTITITADMAGINQSRKQHICVEQTGAKLLSCTNCGSEFDEETTLIQHTLSCNGCSNKTNDAARPSLSMKKLAPLGVTGQKSGDSRSKARSKNHQCKMCGHRFGKKTWLERHQFVNHKGEYSLKCKYCSDTFSYLCRRRQHEKVHFPEELSSVRHNAFQCNTCGQVCKTVTSLRVHLRPYEGDNLLKCRFCSDTFSRSCQLKQHETDHFKDEIAGAAEAQRNVIKPEKPNPNYCSNCGEMFEEYAALQNHIRIAHPKPKGVSRRRPIAFFKCKQCPYISASDNCFQRHINMHADSKAFTCKVCGTAFYTLSSLKQHTIGVHSHSSAAGTCKVCGKVLKTPEKLYRHSLNHNKKHKCNICDFSGATSAKLQRHVRLVHMGEKIERRFPCSLCSYVAGGNHHLKQHATRVHSVGTADVQKVMCDQCGCKFASSSSLGRHKLKHKGLQRHVCKTCNKSFVQKCTFDRHMDAHMGIKRYKCEVCGVSFSQSFPLTKHLQKEHPDYFRSLVATGKYKGKRARWVAHCQDNSCSNNRLSTTSGESSTEANTLDTSKAGE